MIRWLTNAWMRLIGTSPTRFELYNLEANIRDADVRMEEIEREWDARGRICCPSCMSREYSQLADQQERRQARRDWLLKQLRRPKSG